MEKKTIIIISLMSAIISLIYVILKYYGLTRYVSLYVYPIESYSKNYKNLDKIGKNRTVISLTATPVQMKNLSPVIKSLLDQTVRVDLISCIVPYGSQYKLPNKLNDSVSLFRYGKNKGLLNSIVPAIMRETESTTRIITLGASKIYGKDFIETLLEESEKYPGKIIYENFEAGYIDLSKGSVFRTQFFDEKFINNTKNGNANEWVNKYFENFPKQHVNYSENYKSIW